jgi:hypothetical protein
MIIDLDNLSESERAIVKVLWLSHEGRDNAISGAELFSRVYQRPAKNAINDTRELRLLIEGLRRRGFPICSASNRYHPGYFWAADERELLDFCQIHEDRGIFSLSLVAALRRLAVPEYLGQLRLRLEGEKRT